MDKKGLKMAQMPQKCNKVNKIGGYEHFVNKKFKKLLRNGHKKVIIILYD